jgi:hypothetical protein
MSQLMKHDFKMELHLPELDNVFLGPLQELYRACILVVLFAQLKDTLSQLLITKKKISVFDQRSKILQLVQKYQELSANVWQTYKGIIQFYRYLKVNARIW